MERMREGQRNPLAFNLPCSERVLNVHAKGRVTGQCSEKSPIGTSQGMGKRVHEQ